MVEVVVGFRVSEREATCGILAVFQRFDIRNSAAVASQAANGKICFFEHRIQFVAMQRTMQKNIRFEMVVTDNRQDPRPFPFAGQRAYNMEIYFIFRIVAVIICQSAHKAVEAVPVVHFRHSDQVQLFRCVILLLLHRNRLKINSVGDAYGVSAKYFFRIGESDNTVQSLCELVTETAVDG